MAKKTNWSVHLFNCGKMRDPGNEVASVGWVFSMWKLQSGVTRLTRVIKSPESGELFRRFRLQNRQNADEIDSAGDN